MQILCEKTAEIACQLKVPSETSYSELIEKVVLYSSKDDSSPTMVGVTTLVFHAGASHSHAHTASESQAKGYKLLTNWQF